VINREFNAILNHFREYLKDFFALEIQEFKEKKVLLSLSGGPDSFLCFLLLLELQKTDPYLKVSLINFNHKSNPQEFFKEEKYIDSVAIMGKMKLYRYYLKEEKEKGNIQDKKMSQNYFRQFRLQNIIKTAWENNYKLCITGHNLEDLVDTFLMRLGKGSGPWGLHSPIAQSKEIYGVQFFRPLLHTGRNIIEQIMKNRPYFLDPTRRHSYQRNLIRALHNPMNKAGITMEGIYLSILRQQEYYGLVFKGLSLPLQKGYNYVLIPEFSKLTELEKRENIMLSISHIIVAGKIEFSLIGQWLQELQKSKKILKSNCILLYQENKDQLLVTRGKSSNSLVKQPNNNIYISIDNSLIKENKIVLWGKQKFFLLAPGDYKTTILPFHLLMDFLQLWGYSIGYSHKESLPKIVVESMVALIIDYEYQKIIIVPREINLLFKVPIPKTIKIEFINFTPFVIPVSPV
jgi:tRNA(Ile)-lysidine synthetase-like protein